MKQVIFAGSRSIGYRCLEFLLENQEKFDAQVVGVLTNDEQVLGSSLKISELAAKHGVPWIPSLADYLELAHVDILLSVQYHEILKKVHIDKASEIAINLHMAPLPEYRGCNQFSFAIDDQREEFGTTFHRLEEGIDSGAILFEKRFPLPPDCWVQDLYELTVEKSYELFVEYIEKLVRSEYTPTPQEEYLDKRSTSLHYRKEIHTLKQIDPNWDAERTYRRLRATYMPGYPPPFMMLEGRKILLSPEED